MPTEFSVTMPVPRNGGSLGCSDVLQVRYTRPDGTTGTSTVSVSGNTGGTITPSTGHSVNNDFGSVQFTITHPGGTSSTGKSLTAVIEHGGEIKDDDPKTNLSVECSAVAPQGSGAAAVAGGAPGVAARPPAVEFAAGGENPLELVVGEDKPLSGKFDPTRGSRVVVMVDRYLGPDQFQIELVADAGADAARGTWGMVLPRALWATTGDLSVHLVLTDAAGVRVRMVSRGTRRVVPG